MSLKLSQKAIMDALIKLYGKKNLPIKSKDLAIESGKDEGTIRNIMPVLRKLGLVNAIPGPRGGYIPTIKAYEDLGIKKHLQKLSVPIRRKSGEDTGISVTEIAFKSICSPDLCKAVLKVVGNVSNLDLEEEIVIGPTPSIRMVIEGRVAGIDEIHGEVLVDVINIVSIPKERVRDLMSKRLISLTPSAQIREAASILYREFVRAAPVVCGSSLLGIITCLDVARCLSEGNLNVTVGEATSRKPVTIGLEEDLFEAMIKMRRSSTGRLVVVDSEGKPVGMMTRTDMLLRILRPFEVVEKIEATSFTNLPAGSLAS